jgi:hypothetical protein
MENNNTISFIQLVKCIIEYYGTTKSADKVEEPKEFSNEIDEAQDFLNSFQDMGLDGMSIKIPGEIDEEIKQTFLSQLRKYKEEINNFKSEE